MISKNEASSIQVGSEVYYNHERYTVAQVADNNGAPSYELHTPGAPDALTNYWVSWRDIGLDLCQLATRPMPGTEPNTGEELDSIRALLHDAAEVTERQTQEENDQMERDVYSARARQQRSRDTNTRREAIAGRLGVRYEDLPYYMEDNHATEKLIVPMEVLERLLAKGGNAQ